MLTICRTSKSALLASILLCASTVPANSGLEARSLSWRESIFDFHFILQPEDDSARLEARGSTDLTKPGWFQLYFPVCLSLNSTPQIGHTNFSLKFDYTRRPAKAELTNVLSVDSYIDAGLTAINNLSPQTRERLKQELETCGLYSHFNLEPRKPTGRRTSFDAEIYFSSGVFFTVRPDAYYPFDSKMLWLGIGSPDTANATISISNPSDYRLNHATAFFSDPWHPYVQKETLPLLQKSSHNIRLRSNLERDAFVVIKASFSRTGKLIMFLPFLLAVLAFLQGQRMKFSRIYVNIYETFFASILTLILLAPNHPESLTLFDVVVGFGYFAGIFHAAYARFRFSRVVLILGLICLGAVDFGLWYWLV